MLRTQSFLQVQFPDGSSHKVYVAFVGVKGDWPWQSPLVAVLFFHLKKVHISCMQKMTCFFLRKMSPINHGFHIGKSVPVLSGAGLDLERFHMHPCTSTI